MNLALGAAGLVSLVIGYWLLAGGSRVTNNGIISVILPAQQPQQFFRLRFP